MIASPRRKFIICLDTSLLVIFILLLSPRLTGLPMHEVLGVIFLFCLVIHLLLAWSWIRNSVSKFFRTATMRTRFNFFLNSILFILAITELFSGFVISQVLLPGFGIKTINDTEWRFVHNATLNFTVLFAGLHIAINWKWIASIFKKRADIPTQNERIFSTRFTTIVLRIFILILATSVVALLLYGIVGKPSLERLYDHDEIARFTPTFTHGTVQFLGEAFLVGLYVFVAYKWLRIRL